jgi:hypothetical protein
MVMGMAGAVAVGRKFLRQLTGRILDRLADELDSPAGRGD